MTKIYSKESLRKLWDTKEADFNTRLGDIYTDLNEAVDGYINGEKVSLEEFYTSINTIYKDFVEGNKYSELQADDQKLVRNTVLEMLEEARSFNLAQDIGQVAFPSGITHSDVLGISFASLKTELVNKANQLKNLNNNKGVTAAKAADELFAIISKHVKDQSPYNFTTDKALLEAALEANHLTKLKAAFAALIPSDIDSVDELADAILSAIDYTHENAALVKKDDFISDISESAINGSGGIVSSITEHVYSSANSAASLAESVTTAMKTGTAVDFTDVKTNFELKFDSLIGSPGSLIEFIVSNIDNYEGNSYSVYASHIVSSIAAPELSSQVSASDIETLLNSLSVSNIASNIKTAIAVNDGTKTDLVNDIHGILTGLDKTKLASDVELKSLDLVKTSLTSITEPTDLTVFAKAINDAFGRTTSSLEFSIKTDLENANPNLLKDAFLTNVANKNYASNNDDLYNIATFIDDFKSYSGYDKSFHLNQAAFSSATTGTLLELFEKESAIFEHDRLQHAAKSASKSSFIDPNNLALALSSSLSSWYNRNYESASTLLAHLKHDFSLSNVNLTNIVSQIIAFSPSTAAGGIDTVDSLGIKLHDALSAHCNNNCQTTADEIKKALRGDSIISAQNYLSALLNSNNLNFTNLAGILGSSLLATADKTLLSSQDAGNEYVAGFKSALEVKNAKLINARIAEEVGPLAHNGQGASALTAQNIASKVFSAIDSTANSYVTTEQITSAIENYNPAPMVSSLETRLNSLPSSPTVAEVSASFSGYLNLGNLLSDTDYQDALKKQKISEINDVVKTQGTVSGLASNLASEIKGESDEDLATKFENDINNSDGTKVLSYSFVSSSRNADNISKLVSKFDTLFDFDTNQENALKAALEAVQSRLIAEKLKTIDGSSLQELAGNFVTTLGSLNSPLKVTAEDLISDFDSTGVAEALGIIHTKLTQNLSPSASSLAENIADFIPSLSNDDKTALKAKLAAYLTSEEAFDNVRSVVDAIGDLTGIANLGHSSVAAALFSALKIGNTPKNFFGCTGTENLETMKLDMQKDEEPLASHDGTLSSVIKAFVDCIRWATTNEITTNYLYHNGTACVNSLSSDTEALGVCISGINPFEPPMLQL